MIINVKIKDELIVGYRTYPIDMNKDYVEVSEIPMDILSGGYTCIDHKLCKKEVAKSVIRNEAKYEKDMLIKAFEKYKSDVVYGIVVETPETHNEILTWYNDLMNSKIESLVGVPKEILDYMEEK